MKFSFLLVFLFCFNEFLCKHPILLVPGDGGSQLSGYFFKTPMHYVCGRQNKWFLLWLNPYYMLPISLDCFVETIRLEYNSTSRQTYSPDCCDVYAPGFGTLEPIEYLSNIKIKKTSYYYYIIKELIDNHQYTPDADIRGVPYDFRKSPNQMNELKRDLKSLIENMYTENRNLPVILIGHSLGNLYINMILNSAKQEWKNKYIKTFISISGPYHGAIDALRTALSGNNEHIPIINPIRVRKAQTSWPSTYFLMPTPGLWLNQTIVATKKGYYTTNTIADLLEASGIPNAVDLYKVVKCVFYIFPNKNNCNPPDPKHFWTCDFMCLTFPKSYNASQQHLRVFKGPFWFHNNEPLEDLDYVWLDLNIC